MSNRTPAIAAAFVVCAASAAVVFAQQPTDGSALTRSRYLPEYTASGELMLPKNFHEWTYVCGAANRMRRRIASPEMFLEAEMLPHLTSPPMRARTRGGTSSASLWTGTRVPRNTGFPPMILPINRSLIGARVERISSARAPEMCPF